MPTYSSAYYNSAALIGGGMGKRRKRRGVSSSGMSGRDLIRNSVPVAKGSAAAKAKMAALRAMRRKKRR